MEQNVERLVEEATGFIELGMHEDAAAVLRSIAAPASDGETVQHLWCEWEASQKMWAALRDRAERLTRRFPDEATGWFWLGFASRRAQSVQAAYEALKPVVGRFPDKPIVDYNFSCYAAMDGRMDEAKAVLIRVLGRHPAWRKVALEDADLVELRTWLDSLGSTA